MKTLSLCIAICLTFGISLYAHADGCEYDTQCKGDRICENGKCVSPQAAPAAKPAKPGFSFFSSSSQPETKPTNPPYYCCTASEKLGPYPNEGREGKIFHTGDACTGMSKSARVIPGWVCE